MRERREKRGEKRVKGPEKDQKKKNQALKQVAKLGVAAVPHRGTGYSQIVAITEQWPMNVGPGAPFFFWFGR